jgi:hypothetical protein
MLIFPPGFRAFFERARDGLLGRGIIERRQAGSQKIVVREAL